MTKRQLRKQLKEFSHKTEPSTTLYSGALGIYIGGHQYVDVPNRPGFVYVRLRNNTSELIQAHNEVVSPVYGLPVILVRNKTYYEIYGRDSVQYASYWDSSSSYLPKHGHQHEFDPDNNGGGDLVFVHGEQFYPMMTFPSGTDGGNTVLIAPYRYYYSSAWHYAGDTGAGNLLQYGPTGASNAKLLLVGIDATTGNPFVKLGSEFDASITGAAAMTSYVPTNITQSTEIPGAIVRLVTGTSTITWANIYDARQYMGILQAAGGATDFLGLSDTPNSYSGQADKLVVVNSAANALEFRTNTGSFGGGGSAGTIGINGQDEGVYLGTGTTLNVVGSDISLSISGTVLTLLHSDPTGTPHSFLDLTDTPDSYSGQGSKFVAVNSGATALEFVTAPAGGGGGGSGLVVYDDSVYKVTGTAISFDSGLSVAVTGSTAYIINNATLLNLVNWYDAKVDGGLVGNGSTDDTAALQSLITTATATGTKSATIYFPPGTYLLGGALQDTGAFNGQILLPNVSTSNPQITITFLGVGRPPFALHGSTPNPSGYSILKSSLSGASGTAACISGGNTGQNNISIVVENLLCIAPDNPTFTFWNIKTTQGGNLRGLMVGTVGVWAGTSVTQPSNTNSYGVKLPQTNNSDLTAIDSVMVFGFYTGILHGELVEAHYIISLCIVGVEVPFCYHPGSRIWVVSTATPYGVRFTGGANYVDIWYDAEHSNPSAGGFANPAWGQIVYDIDDASNYFHGEVRWQTIVAGTGALDTFTVNGGTNSSSQRIGKSPNTGDQNLFQSVVVAGQSTIFATSPTTALTFAGTGGIAVTTATGTATVTINGSGITGSNQIIVSGLPIYDDSVFKVTGTALSFDSNLSVNVTGTVAYISSSGGGTGTVSVATDPIWDTKGDLAVGTGADTAVKLAVSANPGVTLSVRSGETTGLRWGKIYVEDNFNRADAATVGSPQIGDNPIYYKDSGTGDWGITSNTLAPKSSQTENAVLWDVGCTRYVITATLSTKGTDSGIVFRAANDTNWMLVHANTGTKYTLYKRIGGAYTLLATGSTQTPANGDVIVVKVSAAHIKIIVNGTTEIDYADTALLLPNRTFVGFRAASETSVRFDDFKVEEFYA